MTARQYLETSSPDGDREYVDGTVIGRNLGTHGHSLAAEDPDVGFEALLRLRVLPGSRTRVSQSRCRIPDVAVMVRPYRLDSRVVIEPPFLVVEILSPEDSFKEILQRFRDYQALGCGTPS